MGRKKVADVEIDESIQPNHRPADLVQPPLPQPQAESIPASAKTSEPSSQKTVKANVESPTVPQRRRSSSGSYSGVDTVMPEYVGISFPFICIFNFKNSKVNVALISCPGFNVFAKK